MQKQAYDATVLTHIQRLVAEEHRLFEQGELGTDESKRLAEIQTQLDQCWDLLRQRRALRETGQDPSQAHVRAPEVIKKYIA
jgi:Protein of unknown function (DUF2630)